MAAASSSTLLFGGTSSREEDQNSKMQHSTTSSVANTNTTPQKKKRNLPGTPSKYLEILILFIPFNMIRTSIFRIDLNPDAEVIALSPRTLMATNRFICEVCNKGFQREQNLQLHRRGHNLPWKLKQKTTKEVKRKVYLCPEPTCVHHDPSRALGDLTGIKKHYSRKHGEKKWKCEKCSKRYAVQSDWKAHSKTCGTREYRCDCGTLFSRRDSFITHRAFCDALAQESARHPTNLNTMASHLFGGNHLGLTGSQVTTQISNLQQDHHPSTNILRLGSAASGTKFEHLLPLSNPSNSFGQTPPPPMPPALFIQDTNQGFQEQSHHGLLPNKALHGLMQLPDLQANPSNSGASSNLFNLGFFSSSSNTSSITNSGTANNNGAANLSSSAFLVTDQFNSGNGGGGSQTGTTLFPDHMGTGISSLYSTTPQHSLSPHMSATALLQRAAQMGSTTSGNSTSLLRGLGSSSSTANKLDRAQFISGGFGVVLGGGENMSTSQLDHDNQLQGLMTSLANGGSSPMFGGGQNQGMSGFNGFGENNNNNNPSLMSNMDDQAKLHRNMSIGGSDKLTLDFLGVGVRSGLTQEPQHGIEIGNLDSEIKLAHSGGRAFGGGGKLQ
ncbi:Zinc finger, double-stranded RNA binding [Dillenia turbinata]|uniref:Zinc finger, double-stranded RNA binding n=1 Tax=Dillenia turbinata TaxID=194707 RepID=A0AAN8V5M0_9MAGN